MATGHRTVNKKHRIEKCSLSIQDLVVVSYHKVPLDKKFTQTYSRIRIVKLAKSSLKRTHTKFTQTYSLNRVVRSNVLSPAIIDTIRTTILPWEIAKSKQIHITMIKSVGRTKQIALSKGGHSSTSTRIFDL